MDLVLVPVAEAPEILDIACFKPKWLKDISFLPPANLDHKSGRMYLLGHRL